VRAPLVACPLAAACRQQTKTAYRAARPWASVSSGIHAWQALLPLHLLRSGPAGTPSEIGSTGANS